MFPSSRLRGTPGQTPVSGPGGPPQGTEGQRETWAQPRPDQRTLAPAAPLTSRAGGSSPSASPVRTLPDRGFERVWDPSNATLRRPSERRCGGENNSGLQECFSVNKNSTCERPVGAWEPPPTGSGTTAEDHPCRSLKFGTWRVLWFMSSIKAFQSLLKGCAAFKSRSYHSYVES